jgi:sugar/nucleoside kinase (ribokinase family)
MEKYGVKLIVVTLGPDGAFVRYEGQTALEPTIDAKVVDTNGAGDAFCGGLLFKLTRMENPLSLSFAEILDVIRFANAAGALATTKHGAIPALPTLEEIQAAV